MVENEECAALANGLASRLAALAEDDAFMVAELGSAGVSKWKVSREPNGVPKCLHWVPESWLSLYDNEVLDETKLREIALPSDGAPIVLVRTSADGPRAKDAFDRLKQDQQVGMAYSCSGSLEKLLKRVLANDPLTQFYELVMVSISKSGHCELAPRRLFPPGSRRGDRSEVKVRFEPSGQHGTTFAVVAYAQTGKFHFISKTSVKARPGIYDVVAELARPGEVVFTGVSGEFREEQRAWTDVLSSLPDRLELVAPAHLICLVEASGSADQVERRLDRLEELVEVLPPDTLVSLLTYGPHKVGRDHLEGPVRTVAWAEPGIRVQSAISDLRDRCPLPVGYAHAAQIECVLTHVIDLLGRRGGGSGGPERRPAIVTIGARPAFPPSRDLRSRIIPCPAKNDWTQAVRQLRKYPAGLGFGAIVDQGVTDDIWNYLGSDAFDFNTPVFGARDFAARLGVAGANSQIVPLPLIEAQES